MVDLAELRSLYLFEGMPEEQIADLLAAAEEVAVSPGEILFAEGQPAETWWVLLEGELDLVRHVGREDAVVSRMSTAGRWAGGFRAWDEHGVYLATARSVGTGRVARVPAAALRAWTQRWFPPAVHLLEGLFGTARSIESTARERAALVTLGTLSAGLAHEINNPATAAVRAVPSLEEACGTLLGGLRRLADDDITASQFAALDELRQELVPPDPPLSPLALADREDELSDWLAERGVPDEHVVAPALAAAGADVAWCERVAGALPDGGLAPALQWVASALTARTLVGEVKEATGRISALVASVKQYSQMDRASRQVVDLRDGLESTLVMLGHVLRDGVAVERDYGADVPQVEVFPAELNQVWTNLVSNAVDAMPDGGTLRLTTRTDGDDVVVEVADTGTGMTPEVAARAFDAFFTTKDVGKGTGLGLDIARRIVVERHAGDIAIDSRPGRTVVRVRLPARSTATPQG